MKTMSKYFLAAMVMLTAVSLHAVSAQAVEFKGVVGMGLDVGGDTLVSVTYTDGTTSDVKANSGFVFNAGVVMVTGDFETQLTAGMKFDATKKASNGSANFDVIPVELIEFYRAGDVRLGLGLSYHSSPTLKVDISGSSSNGTYKFKSAMGYVAQIGWAPRTGIYSIDLRHTSVNFTPDNFVGSKNEFSGSVTGLYASLYF